ncbi:hypothetical protein HDU76_003276, partial [Blyttiomyces sp. JEL0837]
MDSNNPVTGRSAITNTTTTSASELLNRAKRNAANANARLSGLKEEKGVVVGVDGMDSAAAVVVGLMSDSARGINVDMGGPSSAFSSFSASASAAAAPAAPAAASYSQPTAERGGGISFKSGLMNRDEDQQKNRW